VDNGKMDTRMEQPAKTCPKCGSGDYMFRSRKKIETAAGEAAAVETKYRCKACEHEWRVRVAANGAM
jgi:DNA-directed RNA polymerase subunit M/transcription elongation factor TFIIS